MTFQSPLEVGSIEVIEGVKSERVGIVQSLNPSSDNVPQDR